MPQLEAAGPERPRQQSLPCAGEKLQSALQKSRIDRATTRPTGEGRLELSTGTGLYGGVRVGRPSVVWLCGLDGWSPVRA